jgi:hypothetical protein
MATRSVMNKVAYDERNPRKSLSNSLFTTNHSSRPSSSSRTSRGRRRCDALKMTLCLALATLVLLSLSTYLAPQSARAASPHALYPTGVPNSAEPSGVAPPGPDALQGYTQTYVNDFASDALPTGWYLFSGIPGGDPGGHFGAKHVQFSGGLLRLNAWKDVNYHDRWVTGGLCQCGLGRIYGAFFVRSRQTGPGPNEVELLWPVSNKWPPEIDFSETGGSNVGTTATVHYGSTNTMDHAKIHINMLKWHTWGVIWTPTSVTYTVDGRVWNRDTSASHIPRVPMDLNMEQRALCTVGRQCPTSNVSLLVDWVAEYEVSTTQSASATTTTSPSPTSTTMTSTSTTSTTTP